LLLERLEDRETPHTLKQGLNGWLSKGEMVENEMHGREFIKFQLAAQAVFRWNRLLFVLFWSEP
jgi:hypothetical protein